MLGSIPIASSAFTPPMPSSMYCARRVSSSPMYRREVIQRAVSEFSGRSASSRNSGTRPTSVRQICATTSTSPTVTRDRDRLAVVAGDERRGQPVGVGVDPVLVLPTAVVDALAEVAVAVQEADRDQRPGAVGCLLEDVAGERSQAARVDREAAVEAVLGGEVRDGTVAGGDLVAGGAGEIGVDALFERGRAGEQRPRRWRRRSGCSPPAGTSPGSRRRVPSDRGRSTGTGRARRGPTPSGSCRRYGRERPETLEGGWRVHPPLARGRDCLLARGPA